MQYEFQIITDKKSLGSAKWQKTQDGLVPFSVADMEFGIAPQIKKALNEFIAKDHLGYTVPDDEYFNSIINWFFKRHKFNIKKEWIVPTPGIVFALYAAIRAYTKEGDKVLIMTPVYHPFYSAITSSKREIIKSSLIYKNSTYEIDFKDFEKKAKKAKVFILCSPHNPVGRVWSKEELMKIGEICLKHNVLVLSDEIHADLIMSGYKHKVFASLSAKFRDNTVTFTAPSKSFNIAGLQGSNIIIKNKKLRDKFSQELANSGFHALNALSYTATKTAYNECEEWLDGALQIIEKNSDFVAGYLKRELNIVKACEMEGTYLMWLDFRALNLDQKTLNKFLEKKAGIQANSGDMFGKDGTGFIRLNIACPTKELEKAMKRLKKAMKKERFI